MDVIRSKKPTPVRTDTGRDEQLDSQSFNEDMFAHPELPGQQTAPHSYFGAHSTGHATSPASLQNVVIKSTKNNRQKRVSKTKSYVWLWFSFLALFLVSGGLAIGYIVVQSAADSQASVVSQRLDAYVEDVYDATMTTTDSPGDIADLVADIDVPQIEDAFLGDVVSADYRTAKDRVVRATTNVGLLQDELTRYGDVYEFYSRYQEINDDILVSGASVTAASSEAQISAAFAAIQTSFKELKVLVDDATLPASLDKDKADLADAHQAIVEAWDEVVSARSAKNSNAYAAAYAKYQVAESNATNAFDAIEAFNGNLSLRVRAVSNDFKAASMN